MNRSFVNTKKLIDKMPTNERYSMQHFKKIKFLPDNSNIPSYDPKKCIKGILEELIPSLEEKNIFEINEHHHFINFFKASKAFIPYYEAQTITLPNTMNEPYSDFIVFVGKLKWIKNFKNEYEHQIKVALYESEPGLRYVLKTFWVKYDSTNPDRDQRMFAENFASQKFNEFVYTKVFSACPHSIKPIELNFVYLKEVKLLISELLVSYGGEPIFVSLCPPIPDTQMIYNIFLQNANALNFLEVLKIAHNDIKGDNILVDYFFSQILIRYIDFDIGENLSPTNKNTKVAQIKGYSNIYVAPEILKNANYANPFNLDIYSPWKCQIFSLGILMLQLIGFFITEMNCLVLDKLKLSKEEYSSEFMKKLDDYYKKISISDTLKGNILLVISICLSYQSDDRVSANELLEILEGLEGKNEKKIRDQYNEIKEKRSPFKQKFNKPLKVNFTIKPKPSTEKKDAKSMQESELTALAGENTSLRKELAIKQNLLEEILIHQINLIKLVKTEETNVNNFRDALNDLKESKVSYANLNQEIRTSIQQLQDEIISLKTKKNSQLEMQVIDLNNKLNQSEENLESSIFEISKLQLYEKEHYENASKLRDLNNLIIKENIANINEDYSNTDIAFFLYEKIKKIEKEKNITRSNFRENMQWENNSLFTGQVNEKGIPQGVGMLEYKYQEVKVIGEFLDGKFKNDMGMLINPQNEYSLSKIINGICQEFNSTTKNNGRKIDLSYLKEIKEKVKQKKGKYIHQNEDSYEGETKNGLKEGKGRYIYRNGDYYEGYFKNNLKEGKGEFIFSDGRYYEGEFKKDKFEGKGKYLYLSGDYYDGDYTSDMKNGIGTYIYSSNQYYEGEWIKDKFDGYGKFVYGGGDYYEGRWKNSLKEGKGKYVHADGHYYEGYYKNDQREGQGKLFSSNNDYYIGNFKNNKSDGKGKFVYASGDCYEGDFKNDKSNGQGKYVYKDGSYYEGGYKNDLKEGKGKCVFANGAFYEGDWFRGVKEGKGKYVYKGGDYYEGDWVKGNQEGKGKYVYKEGDYYEGDWIKGNQDGHGKYVFANGNYHEGIYKNGKEEGKGKYYTLENGKIAKIIEGIWENGKKEGKFLVSIPNQASFYTEYNDSIIIN